jgi:hypothetical protein
MRIARKLMLLAVTAIAAAALTAPASAQEHPENLTPTVEVIDEVMFSHCPEVTKTGNNVVGGCNQVVAGEVDLIGHVFGIEATASSCEVNLWLIVNEDGEGWVTNQVLNDHAGSNTCTREPCMSGAANEPWSVHIDEQELENRPAIGVAICVSPTGNMTMKNRCEVVIPIQDFGHHHHEWISGAMGGDVTGDPMGGTPCEVAGSLENVPAAQENQNPFIGQTIEIIH